MRKHSQHNNDERTHFFRKIYLSHFIRNGCERAMCERWIGNWTDCNKLTPSSSVFSSTSFSFCWLLNRGSRGPGPLWELVLTTASYLQLTEPVCGTGLYNCLTSTYFLRASHLHPIQPVKVIPWYLQPDAPVIYTSAFLIWQLGRGSICYIRIFARVIAPVVISVTTPIILKFSFRNCGIFLARVGVSFGLSFLPNHFLIACQLPHLMGNLSTIQTFTIPDFNFDCR